MKKYILFLITAFTLTSCHKDHKIASLEIVGNKGENNKYINLCLEEGAGEEIYPLKFEVTLKNGQTIKGGNQIWSRIHPEEKCHKIYIWNSFTNRDTPKEKQELVDQIYKGNVKELKVSIYYEKFDKSPELIRTQIFKNL